MADYPLITLLSQLDASTPAGSETPAKIDDAIRQVKDFLRTYLAVAHDDVGALKTGATTASSLPAGSVTYAKIQNVSVTDRVLGRSTAGAGVVEEIPCTAAGRAIIDDVDAAAQRTTLGLGAMALKATVATADIDNGAITTAKIGALQVTATELAANSVVAAKIATNAVEPTKISNVGDAKIIAGDGTAAAALTVAGALTATRSGTNLVFALTGGSTAGFSAQYALLEERLANGSDAGASVGAAYTARALTEQSDAGDLIGTSGASITFKKSGTYLIHASAPAYSVGLHRIKLRQISGTPGDLALGTSESAPPGVTTRSHLLIMVTFASDNTVVQLQHWAETTVATNGNGIAVSAGEQELYAQMEILKV